MEKENYFNGYRLECRLDSGRKEYRKVYKCYSEKKSGLRKKRFVLIIYDRGCTPSSMCVEHSGLPLEYEFYIEHCHDDRSGLPKLVEYGNDAKNVWLVVEYIKLKSLYDSMNDRDYSSSEYLPDYKVFLECMAIFFRTNDMIRRADVPLCITPQNIFFHMTKDKSKCYFIGLDTMLSPSYPLYDYNYHDIARYLPPEIAHREYGICSISYSYTLSLLSVIDRRFPFSHPGLQNGVTENSLTEQNNLLCQKLECLKLPKSMTDYFQTLLVADPGSRMIFGGNELRRICLENDIDEFNNSLMPENLDEISKLLQGQGENPYDNCFVKTEGRGLEKIGGMDEIKEQLQGIKCMLWHKEYAKRLNMNVSNIFVMGPPGVGKSYLAKQTAEDFGLPYYLAHTSDLVRPYHGDSAKAISQLFSAAEKCAPCILILDEVDCAAQIRNAESPGAIETCNELLVQIGECNQKGVLVVATTNSIENIDPAFLRSKRFDKKLYIGFPDDNEKEKILRCLLRDKENNLKDGDYRELVQLMKHFVSADIALAVEKACDDSLIEHSNRVLRCFLESLGTTNAGKIDYLKFIESEEREISENSFDVWCRASSNMDMLDAYLKYIPIKDMMAETVVISYEMLANSIRKIQPSSSPQLEREYERKYQEYLPFKNKQFAKIGFKQK